MNDPKPVATAITPSNTTPESKVDVPASLPIKLRIRLFPANTTATIEGTALGLSKKLNGLKLIFGKVENGKLVPFEDRIRGTPGLTEVNYYRVSEGVFEVAAAAEEAALDDAEVRMNKKLVRTNNKDNDAAAEKRKTEAKAQYEALSSVWKRAGKNKKPFGYHHLPLNVSVPKGTIVGVCINVDAKKKFRQYPLWQVTAGVNDIVIDVYETYGRHALDDTARPVITRNVGTDDTPKLVDHYKARLTGEIWKRSTHPFTAADVDAMPPDRASEAMRTALKKIYAADFTMNGQDFSVDVPRGKDEKDTASVQLRWIAALNENCIDNIKQLNLKADVPSRIHPEAYAAAAMAALEAGVKRVLLSNSWRPMLGSIGHRAGLGLDVAYLDGLLLNRKSLDPAHHPSAGINVSTEEADAFNAWKKSIKDNDAANAAHTAAVRSAGTAENELKAILKKGKATQAEIDAAKKKLEEAQAAKETASKAAADAEKDVPVKQAAWEKQMKADQPASINSFRREVMLRPIVAEVFDPWFMDYNAHDDKAPTPNDQSDGTEKQHNNHLHITIDDPELKED